jgi:hypothetical protein
MMVHSSELLGFLLCPSSGVLRSIESNTSKTGVFIIGQCLLVYYKENQYNIRIIIKTKHSFRSSSMKTRLERDLQQMAQCVY